MNERHLRHHLLLTAHSEPPLMFGKKRATPFNDKFHRYSLFLLFNLRFCLRAEGILRLSIERDSAVCAESFYEMCASFSNSRFSFSILYQPFPLTQLFPTCMTSPHVSISRKG